MHRILHIPALLAALLLVSCGGAKPLTDKHPEVGDPEVPGRDVTADKRAEVMRLFMDATQARLAGHTTKAVQLYQQCLKADPQNAASMFELAKLYHQAQSFPQALDLAKRAVATDKENIWYRFLLADLYRQSNNPNEAVGVYRGILERWPDRYEVYLNLAEALAFAGKPEEAQKVYVQMESRFGLSEEIIAHQFNTLMASGDLKSAEALVLRAIANHPGEAQYVGMLAELYDHQDEPEKALEQYNKALALDPGNSLMRVSLAEHHYANGRMDEAFQELGEAFLDPELDIDAKMHVLIGFFEMSEREGEGATSRVELVQRAYGLIEALERAHPESGKPHTIHGDFLLRDGKIAEAREEFRKALVFEKERYPIHLQLLQLDLQLSDNEALAKDAAVAAELFPNVPEPYLYQGIALSQMEKYAEAVEPLIAGRDLVIENTPLTAQFWSSLAEAYNGTKEYTKSDQAYDKALALLPDDANTLNNYAYYLSLRGENLEKAERMSKRSNELAPTQPSYQDTYAWVLFRLGRFDQARIWMEKAIAASPVPDGTLLEHYGDILFELKDIDGALANWRAAKERGGASDAIDRKISEGKRVE